MANDLLLVDDDVFVTILAEVKKAGHRREVGGLLLGYRRGLHLHVRQATIPMRDDISEKYRFIRKDYSHQFQACRHWISSGFRNDWLGEWHSHPEAHPRPSRIDIQNWNLQVRKTKKKMSYIIIGQSTTWLGMMSPTQLSIAELRLKERNEGSKLYSAIDNK